MEMIAQTFGEMRFTVDHECDVEMANYAKQHHVMAIMSDNTDFLIYEGPWKQWTTKNLRVNHCGEVLTVEYDRNAVRMMCQSTQLPLLATLLGTDFMKAYYTQLNASHRTLGDTQQKVQNCARFIREHCNEPLNLHRITAMVFGDDANDEKEHLIR